CVIWHNNSVLF
nr:immunoglobulin light chain junction region [Macaca mulatta]MPO03607.1 immunoglobulin light chain junction region [Macaca mulatta]MPO03726.1 immunoglobulin light chain junction region [Macaca mulatta]MPO03784.1 immunoglobulin light chain junction region [Macaca mulatta]MPO03948.1 immunoglobulin light chain junction region [Macaca mulatta]